MTSRRVLPIIAVQGSPVPWDPEGSLAKLVAETSQLHALYPDARLISFPEYYLMGFSPLGGQTSHAPSSDRLAESIPGPLTSKLCALASELNVWLLPGSMYELSSDAGLYNTAIAISPVGDIVAKYRKCFPWRPWEKTLAGSEFAVFDVDDIGRVGLMTCYDGWFPEIPRQLAWLGAEVIFHPSATHTSDRSQELILAQANAIVNQLYVVNVNSGGPAGAGLSIIADPEGHALQVSGTGESYLTEVLDFDAVSRVREHGSVGLNLMWKQLDEEGAEIHLPMYGGSIRPRKTAVDLGLGEATSKEQEVGGSSTNGAHAMREQARSDQLRS
jgi:formamidase